MRKSFRMAATALVVAGLVVAPAAAFADDLVPAPEVAPQSTQVVEVPAEETVVETPVVDVPVAEESAVAPEVAPEAPVVLTVAPETLTTQQKIKDVPVWVEWVVPVGVVPSPLDKVTVPGGASVGTDGFAQWALGHENAPTCDAWVQGDWYPSQKIAEKFLADGKLEYGEDHGYSSDWTFRYLGDCAPPPTNVVCETFADGGTATNLNANGWVEFASKVGGTATYIDGGLELVNIDGNSKVSWAHAWSATKLSDVGQVAVNWTNTGGEILKSGPGLNVFVDFDGNGSIDGTLVGEPNAYPGQDWWATGSSTLTNGAPSNLGGYGSDRHGTINEWLELYPDALVAPYFAFAFGTGGPASGVLHSLTVGCTTFSFDYEREVPVKPEPLNGSEPRDLEPVCVVPADGTATVEHQERPWTQDYTWDAESWEWVLGEKVYGEWVTVDTSTVSDEECAPEVTPTPEPTPEETVTPPAGDGELARTGQETSMMPLVYFAGGVIGLGAIALTTMFLINRRRNAE